jgi:HSP20 family protein
MNWEEKMPMATWQSMWDMGLAQAQMEAITSALMPVDLSASGRMQLPSIEVQETADTLVVTAFLPGVAPRDVQLKVTPRSLTFYGQRQTTYRRAASYGLGLDRFQQTIPLPTNVDDRQTQMAYRQGAIIVTLQKAKGFWPFGLSAQSLAGNRPYKTLTNTLKQQGQRVAQGWRQAKHWLGHRLQRLGQYLSQP